MKNLDYYSKATQSTFIAAGILMLVTFPYFFRRFNPQILIVLAVIVLLALAAGMAGAKNRASRKLNVAIAVIACILSSYRALVIFFSNGTEEPIMAFSFWVLQILSLLFFFAIYFSIRAARRS